MKYLSFQFAEPYKKTREHVIKTVDTELSSAGAGPAMRRFLQLNPAWEKHHGDISMWEIAFPVTFQTIQFSLLMRPFPGHHMRWRRARPRGAVILGTNGGPNEASFGAADPRPTA